MSYAAYDTYRTPQALNRRTVSHSSRAFSGMHEDYSRYPYGEAAKGGYDDYASQYSEVSYQPVN